MPDSPATFPALDRLIHEPARLAILTALSSCRNADFMFLQNVTGLSKGNLSVQLSRLAEAGLIAIERRFVGKKTLTTAELSNRGEEEMERYWKTLDLIRKRSLPHRRD
jgi:DNA-binding transcriptional ArsR family regulator